MREGNKQGALIVFKMLLAVGLSNIVRQGRLHHETHDSFVVGFMLIYRFEINVNHNPK